MIPRWKQITRSQQKDILVFPKKGEVTFEKKKNQKSFPKVHGIGLIG